MTFSLSENFISNEAASEFQKLLIKPTIQNALLTPFYQSHLEEIDPNKITLENWYSLPFTNKREIKSAGKNAQNRNGLICNEIFTGGTTGSPLITLKGDREQHYIKKFYNHVFEELYKNELIRALQINNPYHGHLISVPVPMHSHKIGIYDNGSFAYGQKILKDGHYDRGVNDKCTVLVGLERCLRAFTNEALIKSFGKLENQLEIIISYSQYLTKRWRDIHEETWGCPVIDRFGMSEIFGGATQDIECGWWHFDPVCLPEVVNVKTKNTIYEGVGELVLTALYPFQEAQPMIRYLTGDLVEVTHTRSSRNGVLAIRPLGRLKYGITDLEGDRYILTPADIFEVVDDFDEVCRVPRFLDSSQVSDPYKIGHPCYRATSIVKNSKTKISVEVAKNHSRKNTLLIDKIYEGLVNRSESLSQAIDDGTADLSIKIVETIAPDLLSHAD